MSYKANDWIEHPAFGLGRVNEDRGDRLDIEFVRAGTKTILRSAELKPALSRPDFKFPIEKIKSRTSPQFKMEDTQIAPPMATAMTSPTTGELKIRIAELQKTLKSFRRAERLGIQQQSGKRRKLTKHEKGQRRAAARERRAFKARFKVGRGASRGVPKARIISGGRVESKR